MALRLTIFGRSLLLIASELLANAICWIVAGILFSRNEDTRPILGLALLAWTLGLRHALDADHIRCFERAIDNATRALINSGQLPVTCGLFFSLGHSTIVVIVNIAIAVSSDIYEKIKGVSSVGGIVGTSISASFLFIVGLANSVILWKILVKYRKVKLRERRVLDGERVEDSDEECESDRNINRTLMIRILGPIITFVNRPWKMYPVGVLFGLGFDTTSSIALLAISALAKRGADGRPIPPAYIIILPLLFTAGMTIIDSADSILMLYSYAGFPDKSWAIFERTTALPTEASRCHSNETTDMSVSACGTSSTVSAKRTPQPGGSTSDCTSQNVAGYVAIEEAETVARDLRVKQNMISGLSIILTLMSILVAFSISLIEIMALIGANCKKCTESAEDPDGGGLAGKWWRGWANANDNLGYIGVAIVGCFIALVAGGYGVRWLAPKLKVKGRVSRGSRK